MTNKDLFDAYQYAAQNLSPLRNIPSRKAYAIARFVLDLEKQLEPFNSVREKIIAEHTQRDEDNNPVPVLENGVPVPGQILLTEAGVKELEDLNNVEVDESEAPKLSLATFDDIELTDPVFTFLILKSFIVEE